MRTLLHLKPRLGLRLLHSLALFISLAGIAHLGTVLLIPRYAALDSASVFVGSGADGKADLITGPNGQDIQILDADPLTAVGVCGFDLADGPLRISARSGQTPIAVSVHVRGGGVFYAVTDKAAQRGVIEFVVLDQLQLEDRLSRDDDGDSQRELRVIAPARQGIVVIRALVRQPSDRPIAEALVKAMACGSAS
ncbi:MAG: DUF1254 domain-containing protein [Bosea sp. (in: a-proteobacteria)]